MTEEEWWQQDCPARGAGLSHIRNHPGDVSCFVCQFRYQPEVEQFDVSQRFRELGITPQAPQVPKSYDPQPVKQAPNPIPGCPVEHASIPHGTKCPICGSYVEAGFNLASGGAPRRSKRWFKPGLGDLTPTQKNRLRFLEWRIAQDPRRDRATEPDTSRGGEEPAP